MILNINGQSQRVKCDGCAVEIVVTDANREEFWAGWYESLNLDLCPLCQDSARFAVRCFRMRKILERHKKRLVRTAQNSHQPFHSMKKINLGDEYTRDEG